MRHIFPKPRRVHVMSAVSAGLLCLATVGTAPAVAAAPQASCSSWTYVSYAKSGTDTVELEYNSTCRVARALLVQWDSTPQWEIWAASTAGGLASAWGPKTVTASIGDAGVESHACVQQAGHAAACTALF